MMEGAFGSELRQTLLPRAVAIVVGVAAAITYLVLSAAVTVYFDFFRLTSNWLAPLGVAIALSLALALVRSRAAGVIAALGVPLVTVFVAMGVGGEPYVRANLLSQGAGHALLALGPGVVAVAIVLALTRR